MLKLVKLSPILILFIINSILFAQSVDKISYTVSVYDSLSLDPIAQAKITFKQSNAEIETGTTKSNGKTVFLLPKEGKYEIEIYAEGYNLKDSILNITTTGTSSFFLNNPMYSTEEIEVFGNPNNSGTNEINTISGAQIYNIDAASIAPSLRFTSIISKNLAGAVIAPSGEVHIRGEHSEYQYIIDGMPIPLSTFGEMNEMFDPKAMDKIKFLTGGFSAEYGGQTTAIIDIQNRIPTGKFHLDFSSYAGSYLVFNGASMFSKGKDVPAGQSSNAPGDTLGGSVGPLRAINSNGQSLSISGHMSDKIGYFLTTSRKETDRRIDQPTPTLFNDHGIDYFLYGKISVFLNKNDYATANFNYSNTNTQVPFDITKQGYTPDRETGYNAFQTISYTHVFSNKENHISDLFVGFIGRQGGLNYIPSNVSPPNFYFIGDSNKYVLSAIRNFQSYGMKSKYDHMFSKYFSIFAGLNFLATSGTSNFTSRDSVGNHGPSEYIKYSGSDFGTFVGSNIHLFKPLIFEIGARYDQHISPEEGTSNQVSPKIKINFLIDESNSGYLYFARMFVPPNIEAIKGISSNVNTGMGVPTQPERDNFYEAVFIHKFKFGLAAKFAAYYKDSNPGLDDQTIGSSSLRTLVDISEVKIKGIELSLNYHNLKLPLSIFLNTSICHSYGIGAITGGFLPVTSYGAGTDNDHDQRLTVSGGVTYHPNNWFIDFSGNYGSGLSKSLPGITYNLGLFDFNWNAHVNPWIVFNLGGGYTFNFKNGVSFTPSIYINNLFDRSYIIKGYTLTGASYGERRNVQFKIELHI